MRDKIRQTKEIREVELGHKAVFSDCMIAVSISPMVVFLMVCGAIMLRDILKGD
jgi:hypothetical protein